MLCFNKLTIEHNNKKSLLKFFASWEHIFKLLFNNCRLYLLSGAHRMSTLCFNMFNRWQNSTNGMLNSGI